MAIPVDVQDDASMLIGILSLIVLIVNTAILYKGIYHDTNGKQHHSW